MNTNSKAINSDMTRKKSVSVDTIDYILLSIYTKNTQNLYTHTLAYTFE